MGFINFVPLLLLLLPCSGAATTVGGSAAFVHLFEWSWTDVALECEGFLGPMGFDAVQVSPPMEHILGDEWWTRYQPVSYNLTSRSGDEAEFDDMVQRCAVAGVAVIADAVVNHMAASPTGGSSAVGTAGTSYYGRSFAPYDYDPTKMHHTDGDTASTNCAVTDYDNADNVQQCDLVGLVDLNHEDDSVASRVAAYLNDLYARGVAGVRIDAAKHIRVSSLQSVFDKVSAGDALYRFQEVIYGSGEAVQPEEYVGIGQVTEFRFGVDLYNNFHQGVQNTMQYLVDFGGDSWSLLPSDSAVTFTDNHDTQRSETNVLTYKDGQYYNLANYFMLAHPYGHPKVMSSYYFTDTDAGPPSSSVHSSSSSSSSSSRNQKLRGNDKSSSSGGSDDSVDCGGGSTWVCEHRRGGIANMVKFRLATTRNGTATDVSVAHWYSPSDNGNRAAFGFSTGLGFFAVNMDASSVWDDGDSFETGMADGRYCNAIYSDGQDYYSANGGGLEVGSFKAVLDDGDSSGGCADGSEAITVSGGRASFSVPSLGAVAFYSDSA